MSKLEKEEESKIRNWCKKNNVLFIKFTPMGEKGWMDRIVILPNGKHIWMELKRNGKAPTRLQYHRMKTLYDYNVVALWFDSAEEAIEFLQEELSYAIQTS